MSITYETKGNVGTTKLSKQQLLVLVENAETIANDIDSLPRSQ